MSTIPSKPKAEDNLMKVPSSEWTFEDIEKAWKQIETVEKELFNIPYYKPQIEIISAEQMLDNYSSSAMPFMYHHWSFGKQFIKNQGHYVRGQSGLAYEVVINTNPSIAYLLENNTMTMQLLVLAHSICGHGSFFKNNNLFREWTDADSILAYLKFAKNYIAECEEKHGAREVETVLDACHSLQYNSIDKYKKVPSLDAESQRLRKREWKEYIDSLRGQIGRLPEAIQELEATQKESTTKYPEENLLYFIEKNSPVLPTWAKEIVRIVRTIAQYFYPQMQTKLMNEGWATFVHYHLMEELQAQNIITEGQYLEFLQDHTAVTAQPDWDSDYFSGINVYALGFAMFMDIKRICQHPTEEDKKWFPDIAGKDWKVVTRQAMEDYRDESFILQFLSPKVIRDFGFFTLFDRADKSNYEVIHVHDDDDVHRIRKALARQYDLSYIIPHIEVVGQDTFLERELQLSYVVYDQRRLNADEAKRTIEHIRLLWGFDVFIEYVDPDGKQIDDENGD